MEMQLNMATIMKSCNGSSLVPIESRLLEEGKLYLEGEITDDTACLLERELQYLLMVHPDRDINMYITTPGGSTSAGFHIYDLLKSLKGKVHINIWGRGTVASMGAILLAGGEKGRRHVLPNTKVMIHEPKISGGMGGSATTIQRTSDFILEEKKKIVNYLAIDTNKSVEEIKAAISFDNWMSASEACEFGIADKVVSGLW